MSTIRFELRKDKISTKTGLGPIRIVYQASGTRTFIPTDIKLHPLNWNIIDQQVIAPTKKDISSFEGKKSSLLLEKHEIREVADQLENFRNEIKNIEKRFEYNKQPYSGSDILNEIKQQHNGKTVKDESKDLLFSFMDSYIEDHQAIREPGSLSVYRAVKAHLKAFENHTKIKVRFDTIDYSFFAKLQTFLINHRGLNNTTIAKVLSTLKTFLGYAKRNGIKVPDGYRDFTIKKEKLEVIALEQDEFDSLLNLDLSASRRLDQTRDVFCFSCATGLRYSDVAQLKSEHIHKDVITITVKKTKSELTVPLNSISAGILFKYKDQARPLPVISSQRLNDYIKELCEMAGIDKPQEIVRFRGATREVKVYPKYELIHFHTGRKTFCTLSLEKGMSAEEVMEISGHSDYKSFKRYVKVTEKRKVVVMRAAWGEVNNLKVV
jgi:integrase